MNKIAILTAFLFFSFPTWAMAKTSTLETVQSIKSPKDLKEMRSTYDVLSGAVKELEKSNDDKLAIAILKGYATIAEKDESLVGIEDLAPYFKKHEKKMRSLAQKHLSKQQAKTVLFPLENMAQNVGLGNDPSVKK